MQLQTNWQTHLFVAITAGMFYNLQESCFTDKNGT